MDDEIKRELGAVAKMIQGRGGVFEVTVNSDLIFSKKALERFPEDGEVVELMRQQV